MYFCNGLQPPNLLVCCFFFQRQSIHSLTVACITILLLSFIGFYKQSQTTAVGMSRENRNTGLFYSLKASYLFLHILYITGVETQTGRTKRIYKQLQQSTVLIYAHRLLRSSFKSIFSEMGFPHIHTKIKYYVICANTYNT